VPSATSILVYATSSYATSSVDAQSVGEIELYKNAKPVASGTDLVTLLSQDWNTELIPSI
jgi:hypothetical protein